MFLVLFQILNNFCLIIYLINVCGAKQTSTCPVRKVGDSVRGNVEELENSTRTAKVLKKKDDKDEQSKKSKKQKKGKKKEKDEQKTQKTEVETQVSVMAPSAKEVNMRPSTTVVHSLRARPSTQTQVQTQEIPQQSTSAMAPVSKIAYPSTMGSVPQNQA